MASTHEVAMLAELQQGIIEDLLAITRRMESALSINDIGVFSQELVLRQGLFVRLKQYQEKIDTIRQTRSREGEALPLKTTDLMAANREKLRTILQVDQRCIELGEGCKKNIATRLGEARATKKINKGYCPTGSREGRSGFLNGKA